METPHPKYEPDLLFAVINACQKAGISDFTDDEVIVARCSNNGDCVRRSHIVFDDFFNDEEANRQLPVASANCVGSLIPTSPLVSTYIAAKFLGKIWNFDPKPLDNR